jgi:NAD(P)-dependent dehydrogenase (short-subunit alcohol dehydrogenase family)
MPALSVVTAANAKFAPSYLPVALFVGGTSGIGQAMAQAFARYTKGNAHIIICGRNRTAAEAIIATFPKPTHGDAKHEFVSCDVSLMKNVHVTSADLLSRLPKINFIIFTTGFLSAMGRQETKDGVDKRIAVTYYSRWVFTEDLRPLLRKAKDAGEDAKMLSVLAAGKGSEIDLDDLTVKNYSLGKSLSVPNTYNDLMVEVSALMFFWLGYL